MRAESIPSPDELNRASELACERSKNLEKVRHAILLKFESCFEFFDFYILDQIDVSFRAYIFYKSNSDIKVYFDNGRTKMIMESVYEELERFGRGNRSNITVAFEIDSDENVHENYEGDYYLRLL